MSFFKIHFFKERSRVIDIDELMQYFEKKQYTNEMNEMFLRFHYEHPTLHTKFYFTLTPKSTVPDIYRLNPKFLDVNFEISLPILMSSFMLEIALKEILSFSKYFNLSLYHPLFEDVSPYDEEMLLEVFYMFQKAYLNKHPEYAKSFTFIPKDTLHAMSTYTNDMHALKQYFNDVEIFVPKYQVITCDNEIIIGFMWNIDVTTVIPPLVNVCFYRLHDNIVMIHIDQLEPIIDKYFAKVPGTIAGTRVLIKKYKKKVMKFMKKLPFKDVCTSAQKISFEYLMQESR
jgi:hypothetical protein